MSRSEALSMINKIKAECDGHDCMCSECPFGNLNSEYPNRCVFKSFGYTPLSWEADKEV